MTAWLNVSIRVQRVAGVLTVICLDSRYGGNSTESDNCNKIYILIVANETFFSTTQTVHHKINNKITESLK